MRPLGTPDDVSGLTYNAETATLFTVLNQAPYIVELGLQEQLLRNIRVNGARDMEGITHIAGRRYLIAEEGSNRLIEIELADGLQQVDTRHAHQLQLALEAPGNKNFEGGSWDARQQRLLVVKEKHPLRPLEIRGFVNAGREPLRITELSGTRLSLGPLRDLSSVPMTTPPASSCC